MFAPFQQLHGRASTIGQTRAERRKICPKGEGDYVEAPACEPVRGLAEPGVQKLLLTNTGGLLGNGQVHGLVDGLDEIAAGGCLFVRWI